MFTKIKAPCPTRLEHCFDIIFTNFPWASACYLLNAVDMADTTTKNDTEFCMRPHC